jgi:hypothetical protein
VEILMAAAGALSIYLGYRLFCDCAYQQSRGRHLVSGALLAVFGLGILIADVESLRSAAHHSHSAWQKKATEEGSFEPPNLNKNRKKTETQDLMRMA